MTMDEPMDALDRAIMGLPLEEPPAGLRASILRATAFRHAHTPAFSLWEIAVAGTLGAVGVWLLTLLVMGGGSLFLHTLSVIGSAAIPALSSVTTVTWLAVGAATAMWISLFTGSQPMVRVPHRSAASNVR